MIRSPGSTPPERRVVPADRLVTAPVFPPMRVRGSTRTVLRRAARRTWPWLVALLAVVVVVTAEIALFRGRIATDLARLRAASGAVSSASPAPGSLPPLPRPAPLAQGDVTGVRLRILAGPCEAARPCTVAVGVDRAPGAGPEATPWTVTVVDRCRGVTTTATTGTTPPEPGAYGVGTVVLPEAPAVGLVAVTTGPVRVASAATPVGSGPC